MKKLLLFLSFLLSGTALAQSGVTINDALQTSVNSAVGVVMQPAAGAIITVCPTTSSGTPCSPTVAALYTDYTLTTVLVDPCGVGCVTVDARGNYSYSIPQGAAYLVTATGSTITPRSWIVTPTGAGAQGPPGPQGPPGAAAWSGTTNYAAGAIVSYMGTVYVSVAGGNLNHLPTLTMYWTPVPSGGGGSGASAWSSATTYASGAIVSYNGLVYVSISAGNLNNLPTNTAYWTLSSTQALPGLGGDIGQYQTTTSITDNFTRANGSLGANWTTATGFNAPVISSNTAIGVTGNSAAYYTGATLLTYPQQAVTVTSGSTTGIWGAVVYGSGSTLYDAVELAGAYYLEKRVSGAVIFSNNIGGLSHAPQVGDTLTIVATPIPGPAMSITVRYCEAGIGCLTSNAVDNTSPILTGSPGIFISGVGGAALSNFTTPSVPSTTLQDSSIPSKTIFQVTPNNNICYVDSLGNDATNTGLSFGSPLQSWYAAVTKCLAGGNAATFTAGGGTIIVTDSTLGNGVPCGGPEGIGGAVVGCMFIGPGDIHWSDTLASATRLTGTVTLTFNAAHHYSVGQRISPYGILGGATSFNGFFTVATTPTATTLTYSQSGPNESATASTGTVIPEGFLREQYPTDTKGSVQAPGAILGYAGPYVELYGSSTDISHATYQLSGTAQLHSFENILWEGAVGEAYGVNSNLSQSVSGAGTVSPTWSNGGCKIMDTNNVSAGPCILWGGNIQAPNLFNTEISGNGPTFDSIVSISRTGGVVSVTTVAGSLYGWKVGMEVEVDTVTNASFNGLFTITAKTNDNQFQWAQPGVVDATDSTGSVNLGPDNLNRCGLLDGFFQSTALYLAGNTTLQFGGGICSEGGGGNEGIEVDNLYSQAPDIPGLTDPPVYWAIAAPCPEAYLSFRSGGISDPSTYTGGLVKVPPSCDPQATQINCHPGFAASGEAVPVNGPVTFSGDCGANEGVVAPSASSVSITPTAMAEKGPFNNRILMQVNDHRENAAPSLVKFANLADPVCADWIPGDVNTTITCNQLDESWNTRNAGLISCTTGVCNANVYSANQTTKPGDGWVFSVWVHSASTNGLGNGGTGGAITFTTDTSAGVSCFLEGPLPCQGAGPISGKADVQEDGNWQWIWGWAMMDGGDGIAHNVTMNLNVGQSFPIYFAHPVFEVVPLSTISRASYSITSTSRASNITTVTTSSTHTILANQYACIQSVTDTTFNGCFKVLRQPAPTSTTFSYANAGAVTTSSGGTVYSSNASEIAELGLNSAYYPNTATLGSMYFPTNPVVFSKLSACSAALEGQTAQVTDSTTNTWGATITGSGADHVSAYCDGTNWTVAGK